MSDWPRTPLGDICEIVGGGTPSRKTPEFYGGTVPWLTVKDLKSHSLVGAAETITELGVRNSATRILPAGSVVIATRIAVGAVGIARVALAINQDLKGLTPEANLDPEYLAWFLRARHYELNAKASGSTVKGITTDVLASLQVPLPPLEEQRRIAGLLDRAADIRRRLAATQEKARTLIPALFQESFGDPATNPKGWPIVPLGDVIVQITGGKNLQSGNGTSPFRILKVSAVSSGEFRPCESKPAPDGHTPLNNHYVTEGDFLFSRANTSELVGAVAIAHTPPIGTLLPDKIWRISWDKRRIKPGYAYTLLRSNEIRRIFIMIASGTSDSMKNISQAKLRRIPIALPPIELQQAFAEQAQRIEALTRALTAATQKAEATAASLSAQVFCA